MKVIKKNSGKTGKLLFNLLGAVFQMQNVKNETPTSNRGVGCTLPTTPVSCVDWFSCTFINIQDYRQIIGVLMLNEEDFYVSDKGINGYKKSAIWDNIQIYYDGHSDNMGIFLNMSGQGCRQFESTFEKNDFNWSYFFEYVLGFDINVTRIDLAIDDYIGYFTLKQVENKIKSGCVSSRFRTARNFEEHLLEDGSTLGQTIYFGKSDVMIIFYDKLHERLAKGFEFGVDIDFWQRVELQLRGDRAMTAVNTIVSKSYEIGHFICGVLKYYLDFKIKGGHSLKRRWESCSWWLKFLGDVEKISLSQVSPEKSILRSKNWLETQVCGSLATVYEALSDDQLFIDYMLELGRSKMSESNKKMADDFKLDLHQRLSVKEEMRKFLKEKAVDNNLS